MKCHLCIYWTPESGCAHYLPKSISETQQRDMLFDLKNAGAILTKDQESILTSGHKMRHRKTEIENL